MLNIYAKSVTKIRMSGYLLVSLFILEVDDQSLESSDKMLTNKNE